MRNASVAGFLCAVALLAAGSSFAKDKKKGHGKPESTLSATKTDQKTDAHSPSKEPILKVTITPSERDAIRHFVTEHGPEKEGKKAKTLPPGLARKAARGDLPPGWEKKLSIGHVIPVEVLKECKPLPTDLLMRLPQPPRGVITVAVEGKVVRLLEATREILDVFDIGGK